jgi:hypothetical protein
LAADPAGGVFLAGYTAGSFSGALAGDKDFVVARVDGDGVLTWRDQFGTTGNDKGAAVAVDGSGNLYVAGFTDGVLETSIGKFDGVLAKYSADRTRSWVRQFAEANIYLTTTSTGTQVSGLTNTDVFRTAFSADGANTLP